MFTDFYTMVKIEQADESLVCWLCLNPDHAVYQGHFPGMPVVPGACMLRIIRECVSRVLNRPVRFETIASCKFLAVVNPEGEALLVLTFSIKEDRLLQALATIAGKGVLKLKATLTAE